MKTVFYGFPARSHTVPSLALVRELVSREVAVEYHSTPCFREMVEQAGARFVAYPAVCESLSEPADLRTHVRRLAAVAQEIAPALAARCTSRPALVLFDASALWGRIAAGQLGVPTVASVTTFAFTRTMLELLGARADWLTAPDGDALDVLAPPADLKVVYTSRMFQPAGRFLDDRHLFVGPLLAGRPRDGAAVRAAGARPLAYVALGTIFNRDIGLLQRIAGILSDAGWQAVVSLGDPAREAPPGWPPHVQVFPFADQMAALAQADLAVTHGGMGSVSETLACGVPSILVPQAVDQFVVARRTAEVGAAIVVEREAPEQAWQAALARILTERTQFTAAAAGLAASFREATPLPEAVDRILGLAGKEAGSGARA